MKWDSSPNFYLFLSRNLGLEKEWIVCLEYKTLNITATCTWYRSMILVLDTTLCDKVCQWLAAGWWFSPDTPISSTNKTDHHDIYNWNIVESGNKPPPLFWVSNFFELARIFCPFFFKIIVFSDIKIWRYLTTILFNDNRAISYRNNFICQHLSRQLITIIAFCNSWQSLNIVIFQLNSIGN